MVRTRAFSPSPPQRGEGRDGGVVSKAFAALTPPTLPSPARGEDLLTRFGECLADGLENTFHIRLNLPVPKPQSTKTSLLEKLVSSLVLLTSRMLTAVQLDNQLLFKTHKIWNIRAHWLLTAKSNTQLITLEPLPQQSLLGCHPLPQPSSQLPKFLVRHIQPNHSKPKQNPHFNLPNRQVLPPQRGRVGWGVVQEAKHGR